MADLSLFFFLYSLFFFGPSVFKLFASGPDSRIGQIEVKKKPGLTTSPGLSVTMF
jgi:hypothetical protein